MSFSILKPFNSLLSKRVGAVTTRTRIYLNPTSKSTWHKVVRIQVKNATLWGQQYRNRASCSILRNWEVSFTFPFARLGTITQSNCQEIDEEIKSLNSILRNRSTVNNPSILWLIWDFFRTILRFLRLTCTFIPIIIIYPLTLLSSGIARVWYDLLVYSLECSGPIFIKLGQWASTRRDLFSNELCISLARLQTKNKPHSWYYTKKTLDRAYGPNWDEFIILENTEPIGSGCCGQVYKAWLKPENLPLNLRGSFSKDWFENSILVEVLEMLGIGILVSRFMSHSPNQISGHCHTFEPIAIKILHPRMSTFLRRDLAIMKSMANILTWTIPSLHWLSLPDCVDDFAKLMRSQVDLSLEAENLERFSRHFKRMRSVHFPVPILSLTTPYLLVESFENGQEMQEIVENSHDAKLKTTLADIGINTILKMVFDDNFIHGDLHPGNMLVQDMNSGDFKECKDGAFSFWQYVIPAPKIRLAIIDCGIIVRLEDREKNLLRAVFMAVADSNGEEVADLFLNNSTHSCKDPESFKRQIVYLVKKSVQKQVTLNQFAVSSLMGELFQTLIFHKVKIDGCFSAVILAVMVVEGLGRSLDPTINLVSKSRPYLFKEIFK